MGVRSEDNNENSEGELMDADVQMADSTSGVYLLKKPLSNDSSFQRYESTCMCLDTVGIADFCF